jgi:UDP-3-O-[3-hydroxymyristoyl] glucosamine N-acyltransferase
MDYEISTDISSHQLASALSLQVIGEDIPIRFISPLSGIREGSLCFSKRPLAHPPQVMASVIAPSCEDHGSASVIFSLNPRLDFARALNWLNSKQGLHQPSRAPELHPTVQVGENVHIGDGVSIGEGSVIQNSVVIGDRVRIGKRCVVKSGAVIGEDGFGFERDEKGVPIRLRHLGGVSIGDDVEIGSLTTVCRGTMGDTVIEDHVKIDDHVHIAHNVHIHASALITACAEVSGGVEIGEEAWVGPNSCIIQQCKIGRGALIGIGANVIRDVAPGATVAGNPARPLQPK